MRIPLESAHRLEAMRERTRPHRQGTKVLRPTRRGQPSASTKPTLLPYGDPEPLGVISMAVCLGSSAKLVGLLALKKGPELRWSNDGPRLDGIDLTEG